MYEVDYEHVINKKIGGVEVTIYFSKQKNEKLKTQFQVCYQIAMKKECKLILKTAQWLGCDFGENIV